MKNKTIFITGASSGIGEACARKFASEGNNLILNGRNRMLLESLKHELETSFSTNIHLAIFDVRDHEAATQAINSLPAPFQNIDVLINNAGLALGVDKEYEGNMDDYTTMIDTNITALLHMTRLIVPGMIERNCGHIINIGSMASCGGDLGSTAYACAKAGVDMLTKSTALQYGKQNIRCNCVRPGLIVTPENEAYVPQVLKDIFLNNIMVNRYGCPADIANMCVYLGSDESGFFSGQVVTVDGGLNSHVSTVGEFKKLSSRTW